MMGGIKTDYDGLTSMDHLYAIGETACNGVHGKNRLASNSLLEALVFSGRAARSVTDNRTTTSHSDSLFDDIDFENYTDYTLLAAKYANDIQDEIARASGGNNISGVPYKNFETSRSKPVNPKHETPTCEHGVRKCD